MNDAVTQVLGRFSPEEKDALSILLDEALSRDTSVSVLEDLYSIDYEEVPVSIDQFISDPRYLGDVYSGGDLVYPYWKGFMHKAFHQNYNKAFEIGLSGAIGCVHGDTKIRLLDGRSMTIKEMSESDQKKFWVYSWDINTESWKPGLATDVRKTGTRIKTIKVNLSNDLSVVCTPDHPFLLTTGVYVHAEDLKPGDSIQSLYLHISDTKFYKGYLCYSNRDAPVHREVAKCMYPEIEFTRDIQVHHIDHDKMNNSPDNLIPLSSTDHLTHHAVEYWKDPESHRRRSLEVSQRMRDYQARLMNDSMYGEEWIDSEYRKVLVQRAIDYNRERHPRLRKDITIDRITDAARVINTSATWSIANYLGCSTMRVNVVIGEHYNSKLDWILENNLPVNKIQLSKMKNHTVLSIEEYDDSDVYDMTVEGYHNYGVEDRDGNLIFIHNSGKSTIAAVMMTYMIYKTMCLKNPRQYYRLTNNSPIVFVVMNLTLDLAYTGLYSLIVENIKQSPWFNERVTIRGKYDYTIEFGKGLSLIAGSNTQHVIGKNVISAVLDELNFSNAPKGSKNSVMDMYRSIRRRMESRFMKNGILPGFLILVSSKNSELDFLEQYLNSVRHSNKILIVDEPIYNIKPPETYLGPKFSVAVGDKTKDSFIIEDDQDRQRADQYNYTIIDVPIEYKEAFEGDINESLKEIAGITVFSTNKLIPYTRKIYDCIDDTREPPVDIETIYLSPDDDISVMDYLGSINKLRGPERHKPRFAHVDIGLKGDALGITFVHLDSTVSISRTNIEGKAIEVSENVYFQDLSIRVKSKAGSEVPLYKIREFIFWVHENLWKIETITYDGFQSSDSIQLLKSYGLNAGLLSVDRTDEPYLVLRSSILENRLKLYKMPILIRELEDLEYDRSKKKVDHPSITVNNEPGSKDVSDSLCGAVFNAQAYYATPKGSRDAKRSTNVQTELSVLSLMNTRETEVDPEDYSWLYGNGKHKVSIYEKRRR